MMSHRIEKIAGTVGTEVQVVHFWFVFRVQHTAPVKLICLYAISSESEKGNKRIL